MKTNNIGRPSKSMKGELNPRWNNGTSQYPDHAKLKKSRIIVLKNSKGKCEICNENAEVVHHKDGSKTNHEIKNLIALCRKCHLPLHVDDEGGFSRQKRPSSRLTVFYGMPIIEVARLMNVTPEAVYNWNRNKEKREWLQCELKKRIKQ